MRAFTGNLQLMATCLLSLLVPFLVSKPSEAKLRHLSATRPASPAAPMPASAASQASSAPTKVVVCNDPASPVPVTLEEPVDVTVQEPLEVFTAPRIPISASGEWETAGLTLPDMIAHDIIFFVDDSVGFASCKFSMNYVIDTTTSRTFQIFDVPRAGTVELHYEAGIDTDTLRFGTFGSTTPCLRHWVVMGYPKP